MITAHMAVADTWLSEGRARALGPHATQTVTAYLDSLPWMGTSLDWSRLAPSTSINVATATPEALLAWAQTTDLATCSHLVLHFSPSAACILVERDDGLRHLDELFWQFPGLRFAIGAAVEGPTLELRLSALLQHGAGDLLVATQRRGDEGTTRQIALTE